jgi:hypothetical protein
MELRDVDQKNLITNSGQIDASLGVNQYPSGQYPTQDYNPEKPFYDNQNNLYPSTNAFQPSYQFENVQNITDLPHKSIYQPSTNFFSIQAGISYTSNYVLIVIFSLVILFCIIAMILLLMNPFIPFFIIMFSTYILIFSICPLFSTDNIIEISLEDTYVTIIGKAACCKKKIRVFSKNQLIRLDFEEEEVKNKINFKIFRVFLIFNQGQKELLFIGNSEKYTIEEIRYLLFYVNNHINTKMH